MEWFSVLNKPQQVFCPEVEMLDFISDTKKAKQRPKSLESCALAAHRRTTRSPDRSKISRNSSDFLRSVLMKTRQKSSRPPVTALKVSISTARQLSAQLTKTVRKMLGAVCVPLKSGVKMVVDHKTHLFRLNELSKSRKRPASSEFDDYDQRTCIHRHHQFQGAWTYDQSPHKRRILRHLSVSPRKRKILEPSKARTRLRYSVLYQNMREFCDMKAQLTDLHVVGTTEPTSAVSPLPDDDQQMLDGPVIPRHQILLSKWKSPASIATKAFARHDTKVETDETSRPKFSKAHQVQDLAGDTLMIDEAPSLFDSYDLRSPRKYSANAPSFCESATHSSTDSRNRSGIGIRDPLVASSPASGEIPVLSSPTLSSASKPCMPRTSTTSRRSRAAVIPFQHTPAGT